jgi:hypothetical protein
MKTAMGQGNSRKVMASNAHACILGSLEGEKCKDLSQSHLAPIIITKIKDMRLACGASLVPSFWVM